ncbi:MAG: hypothetical protein F6K62_12285 [Sphaerospermopsis sp. SIO1G2]|nr:hypothetical protein [Sphaerospermopsis sp. SIO1G2]
MLIYWQSKNKYLLLITTFLVFLFTNIPGLFLSKSLAKSIPKNNVSLTLKGGLWKPGKAGNHYQDITLDLICQGFSCEEEVWGFARQFNHSDHHGKVKVISSNKTWQLQIELNINRDPWRSLSGKAIYNLELQKTRNKIIGTYSGSFNQQSFSGEVQGRIKPLYPTPIPEHRPLLPQEHPRLIFRKKDIPELRRKAKTKYGKAILTQLKNTLAEPISYQGYVPNGGYHAAGYCLLWILNEDQKSASTAWQLVENSLNQPGTRLFEQSTIVAGVALAYDLCYDAWSQEQIDILTSWLAEQAAILVAGEARRGWNANAWSNWSGRARGAAGLASLAILDSELQSPEIDQLINISTRNIIRFLKIGVGDHGFGSEGDHYTTEPLILTVIPFLIAYENVMGADLITNSSAESFLPHYVTRGVERNQEKNKNLSVATYGRHRYYAGSALFSMGLKLTPKQLLPGIMSVFKPYWGIQGDQTFGINSPYQAAYILMSYPENVPARNPIQNFSRVLIDKQKGFYVFRNHWRSKNDIVASIYLKREKLQGSWSFPDAGSFRISGLGEDWAIAGPGDGQRSSENVVVLDSENPTTEPTFLQTFEDGSGVVTFKSKNWIRAFAVDYSHNSGVPGLFVVVDKFVDTPGEKTWTMYTQGKVSISGQEFTITGSSGKTMKGKFITPKNVDLSFQKMGKKGVILARGGDEFFVVMTVQSDKSPNIEVSGEGLNSIVKVGEQEIMFADEQIFFDHNIIVGNSKF